ncbi:hypothetical protein DTO96_102178 [Ephemeroptericola cinctiostellae]|uniref:HTH cro/C1-type domain-containing protein n=1 Tax=Ephemeroptericola cinctiostellae TaxID=2268024 RepID=A0A345DDI6_9BURK|nr:helix-turn-helix transcriptional regulator [Ephemeroptericola cinctiostellae]AXF86424.1 hypothetical protein DTO96_102178 [Ephemeroptericola cinctiostellae]
MSIGERITEERDRLGFNQEDFGLIGGVKKNAQFQYEKDKRSPSAEYLAGIANAGADVAYILTGVRIQVLPEESTLTRGERATLEHYRNTNEEGQKIIEQTAFFAAQSAAKAAGKKKA